MSLAGKAFRLVVAALVAIPLGPGGVCCCVVGCDSPGNAPGPAADVVMIAPAGEAHSCCSEPAPIADTCSPEPIAGCDRTADRHEDGCDCPVRDAAVESSPTVVASPATEDATRIDRAIAPIVATVLVAPSETRGHAVGSEAPPGPPVRLFLSVFLC